MTALPPDTVAGWRRYTPTPLQGPDWYAAAGVLDDVEVLTAGDRAVVAAWVPGEHSDYYHRPACLLAGANEQRFLGDGPDPLGGGAAGEPLVDGAALAGSVVTVSPHAYLGGAALAPEADADALVAALLEYGRSTGAPLVLSHYLLEGRDDAWSRALVRAGGIPAVLGAHCHLAVQWSSLDEYHHHNQYLRRVGRQYRRWREQGARVDCYGPGEPPPRVDAVAALFAGSARAHGAAVPPVALYERFAGGAFPGRTLLTVSGPDGALRSAVGVVDDGHTLYPKFFGTNQPGVDYFELAYGEVVALAIRRGRRRVDYGGTTHAAKLRRGCRLHYALGVFTVLDERLRPAVQATLRRLSTNKYTHFRNLSAECHTDRVATPSPDLLMTAGTAGPM
jgi:hypothetical protein